MTIQALKFISDTLIDIGINYEFGRWSSNPVPAVFWVGEYTETESVNEDGLQETTIILTGTTKEKWISLEKDKDKIKNIFPKTAILNNSGVAVFYRNAIIIPVENMDMKRMQINLQIKEWSVN
ncbi:MAG: hypothetical protein SOY97_05915 [Candidatus Metalachnospira sp.]|nr:hypothetical protein [Candidatus Metalachnospira sp.]